MLGRCGRVDVGAVRAVRARVGLHHVALLALHRPMGAQANRVRVMRDRLRRLRAGGALEALWGEPVCPRRARNTRYAERDAELSEAERSARLVAARATRLVHVGEPGRARAALERDSALGQIRPVDVEEQGVHGEVVRARAGSVAAEMLDKHPAASHLDAALGAASADDLLRAAAVGTAGAGLRAADLARMVEELFADLPRFTRYVQRLSRLSMPGADLIRFEHVQALVRSGHAAVLRSFVLSVAQGRVPAEARPYVYGGRLVAPR